MTTSQRTQQLAVLLNLIGEEAAGAAIKSLDQGTADELNKVLSEFKSDPPTESEINYVLDDFERFFQFALAHIQDELSDGSTSGESDDEEQDEEVFDVEFETVKTFPKPELTGDARHDLNLLNPYQVAYAIRNDNPNAIAVVIGGLTDSHAGKTLEALPADIRLQVFLQLADPAKVSQKVETQILEATLTSALKVETRVPEEDRTAQLVALAKALPKSVRNPLMEKLREQDEELADSVKAEMYDFDDLLRLGDRDVQKILAQSDSDALVLALVKADDETRTKLLSNMSKRARQTIEDELEFKTNAAAEEIETAQKQIVDVIMRMDDEGEISFE